MEELNLVFIYRRTQGAFQHVGEIIFVFVEQRRGISTLKKAFIVQEPLVDIEKVFSEKNFEAVFSP